VSRNRYAAAYAEALFAAARKLGRAEELGEMLLSLKKRMEEDDEIAKILQYDLISRQEKEKALTEFLPRLLQREKDEIFLAIVPEYQRLLDQEKEVEPVELTLAAPISPDLQRELEERLAAIVGKKVRLEVNIDPQLLGGMVVRWKGRLIDASVRRKLVRIGDHLRIM
jgi:F-type H+-transporting ATPase subunit delta